MGRWCSGTADVAVVVPREYHPAGDWYRVRHAAAESRAEERGIKKGFFFYFFQTYATVMRPFYVFIF